MTAVGETSLQTLLSTLKTTIEPSIFVFFPINPDSPLPPTILSSALMIFREAEDFTFMTTLESAHEHNIGDYLFPSRMITCDVPSSLDAVGFTAVITTRLAELGIAVNPVSGFCHDYLFVPVNNEVAVTKALTEKTSEARTNVIGADTGST